MLEKVTPIIDKFLTKHGIPTAIHSYCIDKFIGDFSELLNGNIRVLDAGAGICAYKKYFSHVNYESTDIKGDNHTFLCSIDDIPVSDNSYDVIICTQVLEHVPYPQKVIDEFYRVLKPGGKLLLTAPQGWMVHGEPYHFFNFTRYGLILLFDNAGFKIVSIDNCGGVFWYLNDIIRTLPVPVIKHFIQVFLFYLDKFDRVQKFTLGYNCYCVKNR